MKKGKKGHVKWSLSVKELQRWTVFIQTKSTNMQRLLTYCLVMQKLVKSKSMKSNQKW